MSEGQRLWASDPSLMSHSKATESLLLTSLGAKVQVWLLEAVVESKSTAPALKCSFINQYTGRKEGEACASGRLQLTDPQTQPQTETCLLTLGQVQKVGLVASHEAANTKRLAEGRAGMGQWEGS